MVTDMFEDEMLVKEQKSEKASSRYMGQKTDSLKIKCRKD